MQFRLSRGASDAARFPCLLLPVWSDEPLLNAPATLDPTLKDAVAIAVESDGFKAGIGETRVLTLVGANTSRLVLLGLGARDKGTLDRLRKAAAKGVRTLRSIQKANVAVALPVFSGASLDALVRAVAEALELGAMQFNDFKSGPSFVVESATLLLPEDADEAPLQAALDRAQAVCRANGRARHLVNLPSNLKSPRSIAQAAQEIGQDCGVRVEVWDENRIREERMGALWGVGMGSDEPPRFIVMDYAPPGTENEAPLALVGKGMSFDTGGYSLKPSTSMEEMKDDMAGGAVVLAAMSALRDLGIKRRVLGVVASAENMVSGRAQRPGDIVTARDGTTIEVLNTDAEGRLILADALTWTGEQNPALIVDFATLTGAIGIALGQEGAGLFSNDDALSHDLEQAGLDTGEKIWRFPLWEEYDDYMKGTVSDLKNIGPERRAGSIAAAVFLRHFVPKNVPWAHLDIAAVSHVRDARLLTERGATGFGVRLILEFLRAQE